MPGSAGIAMGTSTVRESTLGQGPRGGDPRIMHTAMPKNHDIHGRYSKDSHTRHNPPSGSVSSQLPRQVRGLALIPVIRLSAWRIDRCAPRGRSLSRVLGMWNIGSRAPHIISCHILDLPPLLILAISILLPPTAHPSAYLFTREETYSVGPSYNKV